MTDRISGYEGYTEYLHETAFKTITDPGAFSSFHHVTKVTNKSTVDTEELYRVKDQSSTIQRAPGQVKHRLNHYAVTVETALQLGWEDMAELVMGASGGVADGLTHVTIVHTAFTGTAAFTAYGCMGTSIEIGCNIGEDVLATIEFVAGDITTTVTLDYTTDLSDTVSGFLHAAEIATNVIDFLSSDVTLSGVALTMCTGWSFKVDNGVEERYRLATTTPQFPAELIPKPRTVSGKLTVDLADTNEYDDLLIRLAAGMTIAIVISGKTVTLSGCKFESIEVPSAPEDLIAIDIPFKAKSIAIA